MQAEPAVTVDDGADSDNDDDNDRICVFCRDDGEYSGALLQCEGCDKYGCEQEMAAVACAFTCAWILSRTCDAAFSHRILLAFCLLPQASYLLGCQW